VDIFLSYAREDLPRVKPIVDALEARGWSVWWDRTIEPGQKWDRVIETALDEARCVIVLWSLFSAKSDWVRKEAAEGERRGILIPALVDDVVIPLAFRDIQAANLVGWAGAQPHAGFDELASAVAKKLPAGAQPARASAAAVAAAAPSTQRVAEDRDARRAAASQPPPVVAAPEGWWNLRRRVIAIGLTAGAVVGVAVYAGKSRGTASSPRAPAASTSSSAPARF
jgi:hypothetical protein